ncbi:MAG: ABC transporter ATP-binding protein/permease [Bacillales bacterium]|jgi:ATP-binding cassette subfamily B protein|nr:ABC transporter ATP-binding protein/permease [Bacillales bacterium]
MLKVFASFKYWMWLLFLGIVVLIYFQVDSDLKLPDQMQKIVIAIMEAIQSQKDPTQMILREGGTMLLISLTSIVCMFGATLLATFIATQVGKNLRLKVYKSVNNFSLAEINKFSTASLITRTTNDVQSVQFILVMLLRMGVMSPIMAIRGLSKINGISWQLSTPVFVGVSVLLTMVIIIFIFIMPVFKKIQTLVDETNLVARENLTGLRVIRAYDAVKPVEEKFDNVNKKLTKLNLNAGNIFAFVMPLVDFVMQIMIFLITYIGASLISGNVLGDNPIEGIAYQATFAQYAIRIFMSFMFLIMIFINFPKAAVSAKRIFQVVETKPSIIQPLVDEEILNEKRGTIEFINVDFKYPDAEESVLHNINVKISKGEIVAFIGSTGSGKSTVINLIPRFFDVSAGQLLIDGVDVRNLTAKTIHSIVGFVPQKASLFSGTIRSNLNLSNENASDEEIYEALSLAQATEFISSLPEGLDYHVSQGGKNFSGGQKQRLCIARALVGNPETLIFDDSFSALDYKTDRSLRNALMNRKKGTTLIIVAQRIATILEADKIVVLDKGDLIDIGTHQELLKRCQIYQEMAFSQLSKEELNATN